MTTMPENAASRAQKIHLLRAILHQKAKQVLHCKQSAGEAAFLRDAALDPLIQPRGAARPLCAGSAILLTGATGFLGAHLLHDLCQLTSSTIYCLVRAGDPIEARRRLSENLARYYDFTLPPERIVPVIGDLARPQLGLAAAAFEELASRVDCILHNGAALNHLASYERLRAANVSSTVDLLRLAGSGKPKWMYYISSMIAATDRDGDGSLLEQFPSGDPSEINGGYAQTKWVSERLLAQAQDRGFGVTVYRPGIVGGRRDTGAWAVAHDHLLLLLKSCQQMGYAANTPLTVDLTPVDFVSEAMVRLSLGGPRHPVLHLSNPHPLVWTTLVEWMNDFGYNLRLVPFDVWQKTHLARIDETNALFPLLSVYLEQSVIGQRQMLIAKLTKVSRTFTAPMLAGLNLNYPPVDRDLFQKYVRYCRGCGFFPAPQQEL
jgi:myxalamid-type nonribosomal peptide synthetase MxaA